MKDYKKKAVILLLAVLVSVTGCGLQDGGYKRTKIVLTTGFGKDEVFRIDETSCTLPEIMVYLTNTKNQYEQALGSQIWQTSYNGETLESNITETVLARLARIKAMNLLAQEYGITLSDAERDNAGSAAQKYYESLNETEQELLKADEKLLCKMYEEYALAGKV